MPSISCPDAVWLGLGVHKDTISVGILEPGAEVAVVDKIFHDEASPSRSPTSAWAAVSASGAPGRPVRRWA
ncbi:MAG: hypothetical protein ACRD0K_19895 [Egibacteraceae bacterium]